MALDHARRQLPARALLFTTLLAGAAGVGLTTGPRPPVAAFSSTRVVAAATFLPPATSLGRAEIASEKGTEPTQRSVPAPQAPAPAAAPVAAAAAAPAPAPVIQAPAPAAPIIHAPAPPPPPPAPVASRDRLVSQDGSLDTGVSYYGDCSGRTPLTRGSAAIDGCIGGRLFFVGHNPGVFGPMLHMDVGAIITYWDDNAVAHPLRVVAVRQWVHVGLPPYPINGGTVQFQTCISADGSLNRLVDAAPA